MLKSLKLDGVGPVPGLSASFGERLNILTGDNGLGKTFLLDVCFWVLTGTWPGGRTAIPEPAGKKTNPAITYEIRGSSASRKEPKNASFDFATQTWTRPKGRPFKPGLVIYAAVDGSFAVWDPARNYWRDPTSGTKTGDDQPRAYQFSPETLAAGLRDTDRVLCNGLVHDWVAWYYEQSHAGNGGNSRSEERLKQFMNPFQFLRDVVVVLSHPLETMTCGEPRRVYVDQPLKYPVLTLPYGDVAYPHWSAGIRRVVSLAYLFVWAWHEHLQAAELRNEVPTTRLILIVDEIEAHLHPKWQRTILPALLEVAKKLQDRIEVQLVCATHSPLVLASLEPHFDRMTDKLFWFDLQGRTISFRELRWAIQGDVLGWLTSDIFGLRQARSREAETAIEAAEALMRGEPTALPDGLKTREAIHQELLRTLPGLDPFWPRWIVETKP